MFTTSINAKTGILSASRDGAPGILPQSACMNPNLIRNKTGTAPAGKNGWFFRTKKHSFQFSEGLNLSRDFEFNNKACIFCKHRPVQVKLVIIIRMQQADIEVALQMLLHKTFGSFSITIHNCLANGLMFIVNAVSCVDHLASAKQNQ